MEKEIVFLWNLYKTGLTSSSVNTLWTYYVKNSGLFKLTVVQMARVQSSTAYVSAAQFIYSCLVNESPGGVGLNIYTGLAETPVLSTLYIKRAAATYQTVAQLKEGDKVQFVATPTWTSGAATSISARTDGSLILEQL